jgi:hypothetical protein
MQFLSEARYVAVAVDGKVTLYGRSEGVAMLGVSKTADV